MGYEYCSLKIKYGLLNTLIALHLLRLKSFICFDFGMIIYQSRLKSVLLTTAARTGDIVTGADPALTL